MSNRGPATGLIEFPSSSPGSSLFLASSKVLTSMEDHRQIICFFSSSLESLDSKVWFPKVLTSMSERSFSILFKRPIRTFTHCSILQSLQHRSASSLESSLFVAGQGSFSDYCNLVNTPVIAHWITNGSIRKITSLSLHLLMELHGTS